MFPQVKMVNEVMQVLRAMHAAANRRTSEMTTEAEKHLNAVRAACAWARQHGFEDGYSGSAGGSETNPFWDGDDAESTMLSNAWTVGWNAGGKAGGYL